MFMTGEGGVPTQDASPRLEMEPGSWVLAPEGPVEAHSWAGGETSGGKAIWGYERTQH